MECVRGDLIYTGKTVVADGYVAFEGSRVAGVFRARRGKQVGRFPVITPAFVDAHSHIGMCRAGEPADEEESNEKMDSLTGLPDALDSVQMDDAAFADAVEQGVLYSCVLPGSGNIIAGRSAVIRNYGRDTTDALVARAGIKAAFGYNPMSTQDWKGTRPSTRMGAIAILRAKLDGARRKMEKQRRARGKKKEEIEFSAEEEVLRDLLAGKERLRVHVHKIDDIASLLRVVDEFGLRITVEHAMDVHRPEIFAELKKRKIPVVYGPVDAFASKVELKHESWRNIRHLLESGVEFGLMTDHPVTPSRQLFLQTRWFLRCGLTKQEAVELVTRRNAAVLGVETKVGTLQAGKWASFVGWNGDPFHLTAHPVLVYGEGRRLFGE